MARASLGLPAFFSAPRRSTDAQTLLASGYYDCGIHSINALTMSNTSLGA